MSARCPECGYFFNEKEWRQRGAELSHRSEQIGEANAWAARGLKIAIGGMVMVLIDLAVGVSWAGELLTKAALIGGVAALFLGLSVFRIGRLPVRRAERHFAWLLAVWRGHGTPQAPAGNRLQGGGNDDHRVASSRKISSRGKATKSASRSSR